MTYAIWHNMSWTIAIWVSKEPSQWVQLILDIPLINNHYLTQNIAILTFGSYTWVGVVSFWGDSVKKLTLFHVLGSSVLIQDLKLQLNNIHMRAESTRSVICHLKYWSLYQNCVHFNYVSCSRFQCLHPGSQAAAQ